jgi:hypothetical protein
MHGGSQHGSLISTLSSSPYGSPISTLSSSQHGSLISTLNSSQHGSPPFQAGRCSVFPKTMLLELNSLVHCLPRRDPPPIHAWEIQLWSCYAMLGLSAGAPPATAPPASTARWHLPRPGGTQQAPQAPADAPLGGSPAVPRHDGLFMEKNRGCQAGAELPQTFLSCQAVTPLHCTC